MRLAVLYHRFGPYHVARLRAASSGGELIAVEGSDTDRIYAWTRIGDVAGLERNVLFPGADIADQPLREIWSRVEGLLEQLRPDVVALPGWGFTASFAMLERCLRRGVPVLMMNDSQRRDHPRAWWKERLKSMLVRRCSAAFVAGRRSAEYVRSLGVPGERVHVGCNVVDNRHFAAGAARARAAAAETRRALGLPPRYVLASGRFVPKKNFLRLVDAFARLVLEGRHDDLSLVLLGDGALRPEIEQRIRRAGIEGRVRLPGFRQYDELPAYYGLADAFVHVSSSEPWGLVVNEALAAGLPVVVSSACGCVPELVEEGRNGFVCEAERTASIAAALSRLMDPRCDRRALGEAGRRRIEPFTPESFAERLWHAARDAAQHGSRGRATPARVLARPMAHWLRRAGQA